MKRIITLFLAAGLFFGATAPAHSAEFKIDGYITIQSQISKDLTSFAEGQPEADSSAYTSKFKKLQMNQRLAIGFNWIQNDDLYGKMFFYAPKDASWANTDGWGATNYMVIEEAFFNLKIPTTEDTRLQIGKFGFTMPLYMGTANPVLDDYYTGVAVDTSLNDTLGLHVSFLRSSALRLGGTSTVTSVSQSIGGSYFDMVNLVLPVKLDGLEISPWASLGIVGKNHSMGGSAYSNAVLSNVGKYEISSVVTTITDGSYDVSKTVYTTKFTSDNLDNLGAVEATANSRRIAYMLGLNTNFKTQSGLVVGADFLYTGSDMPNKTITGYSTTTASFTPNYSYTYNGTTYNNCTDMEFYTDTNGYYSDEDEAKMAGLETAITDWANSQLADGGRYHIKYKDGYLADIYFSYPMSSFTIGGGLWYASGDDIDVKNNKYTYGGVITNDNGWGPGNSAYFDKSIHDLLFTSGVTSPAGTMGASINLSNFKIYDTLAFGADLMYVMGTNKYDNGTYKSLGQYNWLTTEDSLIEAGFNFKYLIYPELETAFEFNYILPMFGDYASYVDGEKTNKAEDVYRFGLSFKYSF